MSKTAKQIIGDARDVLTSKGWVKGSMTDSETGSKFCARGALAFAAGAEVVTYPFAGRKHFKLDEPDVWGEGGKTKTPYGVAVELVDQAAEEVAQGRGHEDAIGYCSVIELNDTTGSTLEDILSAFDRAYVRADRLEQEAVAPTPDPTPELVAVSPF